MRPVGKRIEVAKLEASRPPKGGAPGTPPFFSQTPLEIDGHQGVRAAHVGRENRKSGDMR